MKFDARVVLEGHFVQEMYLGRQELKCYNIGVQDATREARIDERASLMVAVVLDGRHGIRRVDTIAERLSEYTTNTHALDIQPSKS